ncbi:hypothetical protein [Streptomyces sp. BPTC-684]|uniref:hypothetical protein n=1 Tax=Streptomyces sp. BPTC-684 TaxID=3043734 RepID=UPI0024B19983|nr:hypothetical protein [Streptomyces sp. BPTC-684]WHM40843.1 hypothetical protein QIY60_30825 [Streptomyces sp. BPTC-684]
MTSATRWATPGLHPAERAALFYEEDPLGDAQASHFLRERLARLSALSIAHTLPPVRAAGPPSTGLPRPRTAYHPRIRRVRVHTCSPRRPGPCCARRSWVTRSPSNCWSC